jgi:hypothetical protein
MRARHRLQSLGLSPQSPRVCGHYWHRAEATAGWLPLASSRDGRCRTASLTLCRPVPASYDLAPIVVVCTRRPRVAGRRAAHKNELRLRLSSLGHRGAHPTLRFTYHVMPLGMCHCRRVWVNDTDHSGDGMPLCLALPPLANALRALIVSPGLPSHPIPALHDALSLSLTMQTPHFINIASDGFGRALQSRYPICPFATNGATSLHKLNVRCPWYLISIQCSSS